MEKAIRASRINSECGASGPSSVTNLERPMTQADFAIQSHQPPRLRSQLKP